MSDASFPSSLLLQSVSTAFRHTTREQDHVKKTFTIGHFIFYMYRFFCSSIFSCFALSLFCLMLRFVFHVLLFFCNCSSSLSLIFSNQLFFSFFIFEFINFLPFLKISSSEGLDLALPSWRWGLSFLSWSGLGPSFCWWCLPFLLGMALTFRGGNWPSFLEWWLPSRGGRLALPLGVRVGPSLVGLRCRGWVGPSFLVEVGLLFGGWLALPFRCLPFLLVVWVGPFLKCWEFGFFLWGVVLGVGVGPSFSRWSWPFHLLVELSLPSWCGSYTFLPSRGWS